MAYIPNDNVMFTPEGGLAIKMTAGESLVKGNIVHITSGGKVFKCVMDEPDPIGAAYSNADADASVWVDVSGIAEVYFVGNTTAGHLARGFLTADGGSYVSGQALAEAVPSSPFATDKHFYEIGHVLQSRTGAGLAKVILHFN